MGASGYERINLMEISSAKRGNESKAFTAVNTNAAKIEGTRLPFPIDHRHGNSLPVSTVGGAGCRKQGGLSFPSAGR